MHTTSTPVYWAGQVPQADDFGRPIGSCFIDGRTHSGPWAFMTPATFAVHGIGLGQGKGQRYEKQADGRWLKVEG